MKVTKKMVGDILIDESGTIWIVSKAHEWEKFYDYELRNRENGEYGSARIEK